MNKGKLYLTGIITGATLGFFLTVMMATQYSDALAWVVYAGVSLVSLVYGLLVAMLISNFEMKAPQTPVEKIP